MTLAEILPSIDALPNADKLQLIQHLAADIARQELLVDAFKSVTISYWSPHDSLEGAATLMNLLEQERTAQ
jgi:hypothetical protein